LWTKRKPEAKGGKEERSFNQKETEKKVGRQSGYGRTTDLLFAPRQISTRSKKSSQLEKKRVPFSAEQEKETGREAPINEKETNEEKRKVNRATAVAESFRAETKGLPAPNF